MTLGNVCFPVLASQSSSTQILLDIWENFDILVGLYLFLSCVLEKTEMRR